MVTAIRETKIEIPNFFLHWAKNIITMLHSIINKKKRRICGIFLICLLLYKLVEGIEGVYLLFIYNV